jgi:hypothetical protein
MRSVNSKSLISIVLGIFLGAPGAVGTLWAADGPIHALAAASAAARTASAVPADGHSKSGKTAAAGKSATPVRATGSSGSVAASENSVGGEAIQDALAQYRKVTSDWARREEGRYSGFGIFRQYHGTIYEYLRNDALDAIPHEVHQGGGRKSTLRRNQFGFNLEGPLPFGPPRHRRSHIAVTFEGTRESIARAFMGTVPTLQQRSGNFSDLVDLSGHQIPIYDPATTEPNPNYNPNEPVSTSNLQYLRQQFPGNAIPAGKLDPVALAVMRMYPLPNANIGPFLENNFFTTAVERSTPTGIIGHLDHQLTDRNEVTVGFHDSSGVEQMPSVFGNAASPGANTVSDRARSASISDNWKISESTADWFTLSWDQHRYLTLNDTGVNWPGLLGLHGVPGTAFPNFNFSGAVLPLGIVNPDQNETYGDVSADDGMLRRAGAHTLNFDAAWRVHTLNSYETSVPSGSYSFSGGQTSLPGIVDTGSPVAQFLLGDVSSARASIVPSAANYRRSDGSVSIQDRYPVTAGLEWTVGLSLNYTTPVEEIHGRQSTADFNTINPVTHTRGAMVFGSRPGMNGSLQPSVAYLEPSAGFAFDPSHNAQTVIRGGYRLGYSDYPLHGESFGSLGYNLYPLFDSANDQLSPAFVLRDGLPQTYGTAPDLSPAVGNNATVPYLDPSGTLPNYQYWSLSVERQIDPTLFVRAAYHGQLAIHQYVWNAVDLNGLPPADLAYGNQLYDLNFNQSLRPFPQFRGIGLGGAYPFGTFTQESGHLGVEQRFAHGLMFQVNYDFGKSLDDYSGPPPQDNADLALQRSLTSWDRSRVLSANYWYQLPIGNDADTLSLPGMNWLLGGWSVSGFTTLESGMPLQLYPMFNNTGGVADSLRVNVVPGISPFLANPSAEGWFNPAAFAQPPDFTFGNASSTDPVLRGPGGRFADMSLNRDMVFSETHTAQLVIEAFNAFNHANLNTPDTVIGPSSSPNLHAGKITGTTGGRVVELGLRLGF